MSLEQLERKHPDYESHKTRWHFLYSSYLGGQTYKKGAYLRKYYGEDDAPFDAYASRLDVTPLDNHVRTTIDIYRSYLWRNHPKRTLGNLTENPFVKNFLFDSDLSGQGIDSFMKTAMDWAMVLGYVWINVDRPSTQAMSAAEEMELGIRGYVSMFTPQMVPDWEWTKNINGVKELKYLKVYEMVSSDLHVIKEWYPELVIKSYVKVDPQTGQYDEILNVETAENTLGKIPFTYLAPQKSPLSDFGESIMGDVADMQRSIYNKLSELEQTIRLSGHPVLVKTPQTSAVAGAGGIVTIPEDLDPGLYPQLLQPDGSVDSIIAAIDHDIESIDKMTHLSAVRNQQNQAMSGEALKTERQLLNSKLSDLADVAEETEYKIWGLWFDWMDMEPPKDFRIDYYRNFDTKDEGYEIELLKKALDVVTDPTFRKYVEKEIAKLTIKDDAILMQVLQSIENGDGNSNL